MEFSLDTLAQVVRHHSPALGLSESDGAPRITPIATGKFNASYWVDVGQERMVLRIAPPDDAVYVFYERAMMHQEPALHQRLLDHTGVPVARILAFDATRALLPRDYMLMERLPGRPLTEMVQTGSGQADMDSVLRQVGAHLAETHAQHADAYGYLGAHEPMPPQRRWVDAFALMWQKLVDDVVAVGYYDEAERSTLLTLLDRHLPHFDRPVPASLLHMDIWHQNILVDAAGTVTGLLDWDRALWGDPEIEFAVLDYCGLSGPAFWEGYGRARDRSPGARVRQIFYLLYEVQKYMVIYHGRDGNPQGARQKKQQVLQLVREHFDAP